DSAGLACDGGDAAERPRIAHLDVMAALAQSFDRLFTDAVLDRDVPRARFARVEALRERLGVVLRRVDRRLEVEAVVDVGEKCLQRPLILLVAAGRTDREVRLAVAGGER